MKKRNIALLLAVIILCTGCFSGCKKEGKYGSFYPYNLSKYVTLGDYTNISYELQKVSVDDSDVEAEIRTQLKKFKLTTLQEKTSAIENGNTAVIDYVGYLDGETFEGGSAKGASLEIGSGTFIEGFESGLIGKSAGDKVSLDLKFPDTYSKKEYAGKDVRFEVTVNLVYEDVYPELTKDIVRSISTSITVEEYRENLYNSLLESETEQVETNNRNNLIQAVIDCCEIKKYPKDEVEKYKSNLILQYTDTASKQDLTLETFVSYNGLTMDEFEEQMEKVAQNLTAKEMVFLMIAEKAEIELTDEEYEKGLAEYMNKNSYTSRKAFLEAIGEDRFRGLLLIDKAIEHIQSLED